MSVDGRSLETFPFSQPNYVSSPDPRSKDFGFIFELIVIITEFSITNTTRLKVLRLWWAGASLLSRDFQHSVQGIQNGRKTRITKIKSNTEKTAAYTLLQTSI